jgi:hypothetical protein
MASLFTVDLEALRQYSNHSDREIKRVSRNLHGLSDDDKAELIRTPELQVSLMEESAALNLAFLQKVTDRIKTAEAPKAGGNLEKLRERAPDQKKVEKLLCTIAREWSTEGEEERRQCFQHLLGSLDSHLAAPLEQAKSSGAAVPRILCPSAHLGRLPFEVQKRGYSCEACEDVPFSYFVSELLRQEGGVAEAHCIRPYVLGTCNRVRATDNIRDVRFPEVPVTADSLPHVHLDDFVRRYDTADSRGTFDAVLTNYCLDTSTNIFRYVRTVAHVVRPGGLWANFGPLAFDQSHDEAHGQGIEVSWEELKFAISHFFEIREEAFVEALYAENARAMMQFQYGCIAFSATRNDKPSPGIGVQLLAA